MRYYLLEADRLSLTPPLLKAIFAQLQTFGGYCALVGGRWGLVIDINGRLGPKNLFDWQANNFSDRLTGPLVRGGGRLVETDRDTAMGRVECLV